jgi:pyruvate formate lyase activating enzyme
MKIAGLQKLSLIDFPERLAATVFLAGCNLNCSYCYNRWMLDAGRVAAALSVEELLRFLRQRAGLLDGVCLSGGEPTLHEELAELLRAIKSLGYATKLDTNGTLPERLEPLLHQGLVDYVAMDLKAPLDARYAEVARRPVDLAALRRSMELIRAWGGAYEWRTTIIPTLDEAALRDIAAVVRPEERWYWQRFVPTEGVAPELAALPALDEDGLLALARRLQDVAPGVRVRGRE